MISFSARLSNTDIYFPSILFSSCSVIGCKYDFLLNCSIAVLTNILLIHPSKEPSPRKLLIFLKTFIKPSCKMSSASSAFAAYRKQTPYIFGENRSYNSYCILRSSRIHPSIKSDSLLIWLLNPFKIISLEVVDSKILPTWSLLFFDDYEYFFHLKSFLQKF